MAKDKSAVASPGTKRAAKAERKAQRKAAKAARKAEKLANKKASGAGPKGVTKVPSGKKEKKAARRALAEKVLNEIEGKTAKESVKKEVKDDGEDEESSDEEGEDMDVSGVKVEQDDKDESDEEDSKMNGANESDDKDAEETATDAQDTLEKAQVNPEKVAKKESTVEEKKKILAERPVGALVPFANPLADEKVAKKVFKGVKKGKPVFAATSRLANPTPIRKEHAANMSKFSCRPPHPQTRRKRSRQSTSQIPNRQPETTHRHRHPGRRYLAHGRHLAPSRARRRSQHSLHLRDQSCRTGHRRTDKAADERCYGES